MSKPYSAARESIADAFSACAFSTLNGRGKLMSLPKLVFIPTRDSNRIRTGRKVGVKKNFRLNKQFADLRSFQRVDNRVDRYQSRFTYYLMENDSPLGDMLCTYIQADLFN